MGGGASERAAMPDGVHVSLIHTYIYVPTAAPAGNGVQFRHASAYLAHAVGGATCPSTEGTCDGAGLETPGGETGAGCLLKRFRRQYVQVWDSEWLPKA